MKRACLGHAAFFRLTGVIGVVLLVWLLPPSSPMHETPFVAKVVWALAAGLGGSFFVTVAAFVLKDTGARLRDRAQLGQAYAMTGDPEKAREVLDQLHRLGSEQYVSPYHFAYVYTGLGEQDAAIDWLERAYGQRAGALYGIKGSFLFTSLREHPRFVALLRKMNLA